MNYNLILLGGRTFLGNMPPGGQFQLLLKSII